MNLHLQPYDFYIKEKKVMSMFYNNENIFSVSSFESISVRCSSIFLSYYRRYTREQIISNKTIILPALDNRLDDYIDIISYLSNEELIFDRNYTNAKKLKSTASAFINLNKNLINCCFTKVALSLKNKIFFFHLTSDASIVKHLALSNIEKIILRYLNDTFDYINKFNNDKKTTIQIEDIITALNHFIDHYYIFLELQKQLVFFFNSLLCPLTEVSLDENNEKNRAFNLFISQYEYIFFMDVLNYKISTLNFSIDKKDTHLISILDYPKEVVTSSAQVVLDIFNEVSLFYIYLDFHKDFFTRFAVHVASIITNTKNKNELVRSFAEYYEGYVFTFFDKNSIQFISPHNEQLVDFSYICNIIKSLDMGINIPLTTLSAFLKNHEQ